MQQHPQPARDIRHISATHTPAHRAPHHPAHFSIPRTSQRPAHVSASPGGGGGGGGARRGGGGGGGGAGAARRGGWWGGGGGGGGGGPRPPTGPPCRGHVRITGVLLDRLPLC
ncbi:hypothetical protein [Nocardia brasiliensis]|uniref:hypothetical protein n=1 Tax=Nocardia brasiliensis TaxID=37326 RepID=UPI002455382C|nr:hypothetical protein [Nocardia brasiliensis]